MATQSTDIVPVDKLIQILEKNMCTLKVENYNLDIDVKFRDKAERFCQLSCNVTDKLQSLLHLSENYTCAGNDLKQFVSRIDASRISAIKQIYEKYSEIRMASRTQVGAPLSLILEKIKRERSLVRELLHINKDKYDFDHLEKCYTLLSEIENLLSNLEKYDNKLQYYLSISKLIPFLVKLESDIDSGVSTFELLPVEKLECSELDAFATVVKLLTGELLDDERTDPHQVLAESAPRKPVFIIKTKRRADIPTIVKASQDQ